MYTPIINYAEKDDLDAGDPDKIIRGRHISAELEAISEDLARIDKHGIVASCKYNGQWDVGPNYGLMYSDNVKSVYNGWAPSGGGGAEFRGNPTGLLPGQYQVNFETPYPEFDDHYAVQITTMPSFKDGLPAYPTIASLQAFYADSVIFTISNVNAPEGVPEIPVGFSLMIIDMETK